MTQRKFTMPPPGDKPYLGFYVGADGVATNDVLIDPGPKHLMTFGTPGANKTTGLVIENVLNTRASSIIMDTKGQIAAICKRHLESVGHRCVVLNGYGELTDIRPDLKSDRWNPMDHIDLTKPDAITKSRAISEAMSEQSPDARHNYFEITSENACTSFIMHTRRVKGRDATLRDVRALMAQEPNDMLMTLREMQATGEDAEQIIASRLLARLKDKNAQTTSIQDTIETSMKNMAWLDDPRIADDMAKGSAIDFAAMHKELTTIFFILPPGQLVRQAKYMRMFFKIAFTELFENVPRKALLPPVMMYMDEFGNLGYMAEILAAQNIARDYRLKTWIFLQHSGQLDVYGKNASAFYAGAGVIQTFDCRDWQTAEMFSKIFGKREVERHSTTTNQGFNLRSMSFTDSRQSHVFPFIEPEDLWRMGRGRMMQFIDPCPWPIPSIAPGYWQLDGLPAIDPNPYYLGE